MKPVRLNTLVVDTSVFAKRPSPAEVKVFFETKLHLDMTNVKRIQLHNIKNVVYLGMKDLAVAERIAADHHLKHHMMIGGKEIPIPVPVYVESSTTDVRLHDLPEEIDNQTIIDHMAQYGEVISIREELWKNFWPGFSNGVIVCRMRLAQHIPSYVNFPEFEDSVSLVSYRGQPRTCSKCARAIHPKQRCSEAAAAEKQNSTSNAQTTATVVAQANNNIHDRRPAVIAPSSSAANEAAPQTKTAPTKTMSSFPALPSKSPTPPTPSAPITSEPQRNSKPASIKRQLSIDVDNGHKFFNPNKQHRTSGGSSNNACENEYTTDSTDPELIFNELLSECDTSHIPEAVKHDNLLRIAQQIAADNVRRLREKK